MSAEPERENRDAAMGVAMTVVAGCAETARLWPQGHNPLSFAEADQSFAELCVAPLARSAYLPKA
jgi:hypothetical protein